MQQTSTFKKSLNIALAIIVIAMTWLVVAHPDWIIAGPPVHAEGIGTSDKFDGECTGTETAGRCADKCPNPTDTLQGYDKETGAAVCRSAPTGCPYGDSVPLGPDCDKLAPAQTVYNDPQLPDPQSVDDIQGK